MNSLIVVHPTFDAVWPFAADHFHKIWMRQGAVEFIRLTPSDRRTLGQVLRGPTSATRIVTLGMSVATGCLANLPELREAAIYGTYDPSITPDVRKALEDRKVKLYEHPTEGYWGQSVAEYALAMTLCGLRRIPQAYRHMMHSRKPWDYSPRGGVGKPGGRGHQFSDDPAFVNGTIEGKRVRVVGMGNIASRYASFTHMLGADVAAWDPVAPEPCFHRTGARRERRLSLLMRDADIFAPMMSLTPATRGVITKDAIWSLPKGCLVVLVHHAELVDMAALRERVVNDELALAADVFDTEPLDPSDPLLGRNNVVHTPHMGGRTRHANEMWAQKLAEMFEPVG